MPVLTDTEIKQELKSEGMAAEREGDPAGLSIP